MSKLYRSNRDRKFTGLIGGVSNMLGIDSTLIRLIFVISIFCTWGTTLLIYFIASLVVPKEPFYHDPYGPPGPGSGQAGYNYDPRGFNQGHYQGYNGHNHNYRRDENCFGTHNSGPGYSKPEPEDDLDAMMKDIEKKALKKEIEELKKKLSEYEKGDL